jgi:hypothetical protein
VTQRGLQLLQALSLLFAGNQPTWSLADHFL